MASSEIKKRELGSMQTYAQSDFPLTITQDGFFTLLGIPSSGTATAVIRIIVERGGSTYKVGNGSSLGVVASVTFPVKKGDKLTPDYAYSCTISGQFFPLE